jgi:uncharacterized membrane protein
MPKSTASIAGHPLHPMIIPFPVAFLVTAFATDLAFWGTGSDGWAVASMWLLGAGVVMALLAAVFGFTDFFGDRQIGGLSDAWQHMIGNLIVVVLALVNWYLRYRTGGGWRRVPGRHLAFARDRAAAVVQRLERLGDGLSAPRRGVG